VHSVGGGAVGARVNVLVHGGPGLSLGYLSIFASLASPARQIVSYDQRSAGLSTRPVNGHYGLAAQISDLAAVRRWTGAQQITILGHSWGGIPAAVYTATHPDHVAALALLDAIPLNWSVAIAGFNRRNAIVTRLQRVGLIPNPLPPIRHNSCLALVKALTPAYLANPRLPVNRSAVWGSSCTQSTAVRTGNAFSRDRGELPGLASALGRWHGRALVLEGARIRSGCSGCAPPSRSCGPHRHRGSWPPSRGTSRGSSARGSCCGPCACSHADRASEPFVAKSRSPGGT
jgi:pimeloyl-ACP methyl ester carboxylesterase